MRTHYSSGTINNRCHTFNKIFFSDNYATQKICVATYIFCTTMDNNVCTQL